MANAKQKVVERMMEQARNRGLAYYLAGIDPALWRAVKKQAAADGQTIRQFIFRALKLALARQS